MRKKLTSALLSALMLGQYPAYAAPVRKNPDTIEQEQPSKAKEIWENHKEIIIGSAVVTVAIPTLLIVGNKMLAKNDEPPKKDPTPNIPKGEFYKSVVELFNNDKESVEKIKRVQGFNENSQFGKAIKLLKTTFENLENHQGFNTDELLEALNNVLVTKLDAQNIDALVHYAKTTTTVEQIRNDMSQLLSGIINSTTDVQSLDDSAKNAMKTINRTPLTNGLRKNITEELQKCIAAKKEDLSGEKGALIKSITENFAQQVSDMEKVLLECQWLFDPNFTEVLKPRYKSDELRKNRPRDQIPSTFIEYIEYYSKTVQKAREISDKMKETIKPLEQLSPDLYLTNSQKVEKYDEEISDYSAKVEELEKDTIPQRIIEPLESIKNEIHRHGYDYKDAKSFLGEYVSLHIRQLGYLVEQMQRAIVGVQQYLERIKGSNSTRYNDTLEKVNLYKKLILDCQQKREALISFIPASFGQQVSDMEKVLSECSSISNLGSLPTVPLNFGNQEDLPGILVDFIKNGSEKVGHARQILDKMEKIIKPLEQSDPNSYAAISEKVKEYDAKIGEYSDKAIELENNIIPNLIMTPLEQIEAKLIRKSFISMDVKSFLSRNADNRLNQFKSLVEKMQTAVDGVRQYLEHIRGSNPMCYSDTLEKVNRYKKLILDCQQKIEQIEFEKHTAQNTRREKSDSAGVKIEELNKSENSESKSENEPKIESESDSEIKKEPNSTYDPFKMLGESDGEDEPEATVIQKQVDGMINNCEDARRKYVAAKKAFEKNKTAKNNFALILETKKFDAQLKRAEALLNKVEEGQQKKRLKNKIKNCRKCLTAPIPEGSRENIRETLNRKLNKIDEILRILPETNAKCAALIEALEEHKNHIMDSLQKLASHSDDSTLVNDILEINTRLQHADQTIRNAEKTLQKAMISPLQKAMIFPLPKSVKKDGKNKIRIGKGPTVTKEQAREILNKKWVELEQIKSTIPPNTMAPTPIVEKWEHYMRHIPAFLKQLDLPENSYRSVNAASLERFSQDFDEVAGCVRKAIETRKKKIEENPQPQNLDDKEDPASTTKKPEGAKPEAKESDSAGAENAQPQGSEDKKDSASTAAEASESKSSDDENETVTVDLATRFLNIKLAEIDELLKTLPDKGDDFQKIRIYLQNIVKHIHKNLAKLISLPQIDAKHLKEYLIWLNERIDNTKKAIQIAQRKQTAESSQPQDLDDKESSASTAAEASESKSSDDEDETVTNAETRKTLEETLGKINELISKLPVTDSDSQKIYNYLSYHRDYINDFLRESESPKKSFLPVNKRSLDRYLKGVKRIIDYANKAIQKTTEMQQPQSSIDELKAKLTKALDNFTTDVIQLQIPIISFHVNKTGIDRYSHERRDSAVGRGAYIIQNLNGEKVEILRYLQELSDAGEDTTEYSTRFNELIQKISSHKRNDSLFTMNNGMVNRFLESPVSVPK